MTVGIMGTGQHARCLGAMEILLKSTAEPGVYSYVNKEQYEDLVEYRMGDADTDDQVRRAQEIALAAWRALGCRDAGRVDVRCDANGNPQFIEVNPLAGLHPIHSDLPILAKANGTNFVDLIGQIIESASTRCARQSKRPIGPTPFSDSLGRPIQLSLEER
jgi:D-alanine-D-alanine ligase